MVKLAILREFSVPIHRNKDMKIGLLRNLLKTAGLLSMFEGKADRSNDEPDLEIAIDPSSTIKETMDANTIDEIGDPS